MKRPNGSRVRSGADFQERTTGVYAPPVCKPGMVHYNCEHAIAHFTQARVAPKPKLPAFLADLWARDGWGRRE